MSLQARNALVNSGRLVFQAASQRTDLLDPARVQTEVIAMLQYLTREFWIELTAVRTDHHDDSDLNPTPPHEGTHACGWAVDCWPLNSSKPGDYMDAGDAHFRDFLGAIAQGPFYYQTGLAGEAYTQENMAAAGAQAFCDDGGDHVHIGCQ